MHRLAGQVYAYNERGKSYFCRIIFFVLDPAPVVSV